MKMLDGEPEFLAGLESTDTSKEAKASEPSAPAIADIPADVFDAGYLPFLSGLLKKQAIECKVPMVVLGAEKRSIKKGGKLQWVVDVQLLVKHRNLGQFDGAYKPDGKYSVTFDADEKFASRNALLQKLSELAPCGYVYLESTPTQDGQSFLTLRKFTDEL